MTHGGAFLRLIDRQAQSRAVARFHDLIALSIIAPLIAGRMSSALAVEKQSRAREKQLDSVHGLGLPWQPPPLRVAPPHDKRGPACAAAKRQRLDGGHIE